MVANHPAIESKIFEIANSLSNFRFTSPLLFGGSAGASLFYHSLYSLTGNSRYFQISQDILLATIKQLNETSFRYTMSEGYAGIFWFIQYCQQNGLIDIEDNYFDEAEALIYGASIRDLNKGHYDYLHGGLSPVLFALRRYPKDAAGTYLDRVVSALKKTKIEDFDGIRWEDKFSQFSRPFEGAMFNLSLSHGVTSVINLLLRIYELGVRRATISHLLEGSLSWLTKCKIGDETMASIYPNCSFGNCRHNNGTSRLSWCYGDMGIAWTFLLASRILKEDVYRNEALRIIEKASRRTEPLSDPNFDAAFCHGASGIAYLFKRFYKETELAICMRAHSFWLSQTLGMANNSQECAGFKFYKPLGQKKWSVDYGLLEGLAGVGLVLIDNLIDFNEWDECMLVSAKNLNYR